MSSVLDFPLDRPMPQAPDAERAVLGSVLWNANAFHRVAQIVAESDFYRDAHRVIFAAMAELDADGITADIVTLRDHLARRGKLDAAGGYAFVSSLVDGIPDTANVERYARIVKEKSQLRRVIAIGAEMQRRGMDSGEKSFEIAADAAEKTQLVRPLDANSVVLNLTDVARRLEELYLHGGVKTGFSTGWASVDEYYRIGPGAWTLVTGIPGHGKSSYLDALLLNTARLHGWHHVVFSAENFPPESHIASLIEKHVGQPFNVGPTTRMNAERLTHGLGFVAKHFRFIDPATERMTVDRILATASALAETRKVDTLTIDPWNELHHDRPKELREDEYISVALTKLRRWARKHEAHVFLVVHPSKMVKDRNTNQYGVPTPYDVNGGAMWRNKADYCLTVYRDITDGDRPEVAIHVQKVRRREMGRIGVAMLRYDKVTSQYHDPSEPRRGWEDAW